MNADFQRCIDLVCGPSIEGGFVNDPADPGGATNHGITLATLSHWRGQTCTVDDVRNLGQDEATTIYRASYWNVVAGDELPAGLDLIVFDCAVNQGPGTAARILQTVVGVPVDGQIGPATLAAVASRNAIILIVDVGLERMVRYHETPGWDRFGHGWTNRVESIQAQAKAMVA